MAEDREYWLRKVYDLGQENERLQLALARTLTRETYDKKRIAELEHARNVWKNLAIGGRQAARSYQSIGEEMFKVDKENDELKKQIEMLEKTCAIQAETNTKLGLTVEQQSKFIERLKKDLATPLFHPKGGYGQFEGK